MSNNYMDTVDEGSAVGASGSAAGQSPTQDGFIHPNDMQMTEPYHMGFWETLFARVLPAVVAVGMTGPAGFGLWGATGAAAAGAGAAELGAAGATEAGLAGGAAAGAGSAGATAAGLGGLSGIGIAGGAPAVVSIGAPAAAGGLGAAGATALGAGAAAGLGGLMSGGGGGTPTSSPSQVAPTEPVPPPATSPTGVGTGVGLDGQPIPSVTIGPPAATASGIPAAAAGLGALALGADGMGTGTNGQPIPSVTVGPPNTPTTPQSPNDPTANYPVGPLTLPWITPSMGNLPSTGSSQPASSTTPTGGIPNASNVTPTGVGTPGSLTGLGNVLGGLLSGNVDRIKADQDSQWWKSQIDTLMGMYKPGTPEATLMQQQMEAKDAATGRRSQYGIRETDLAAQLASKRAGIMTSAGYQNMANAYRQRSSQDLAGLFGAVGANGGLGNTISQGISGIGSLVNGLGGLFGGG